MSKSRGNAIALAASEDETARLIRGAKTDAERLIRYEPERRPEVANLLLLAALCLETTPEVLAEQIGNAGSAALKRLVTEAVNERLRPIRRKRTKSPGKSISCDRSWLRGLTAPELSAIRPLPTFAS